MSDVMLLGVLRMPMPDNPDALTLRQFVSRAQQAACRIEADTDEISELKEAYALLFKDNALLRAEVQQYREQAHRSVNDTPATERRALRPGPNGECYYCGAICDTPCHELKCVDLAKNGCARLRA
jgi:hypothetical protein